MRVHDAFVGGNGGVVATDDDANGGVVASASAANGYILDDAKAMLATMRTWQRTWYSSRVHCKHNETFGLGSTTIRIRGERRGDPCLYSLGKTPVSAQVGKCAKTNESRGANTNEVAA